MPHLAAPLSSSTSLSAEKSAALPFLPYPENLKGYAGDVGFDPLGFSDWIPMDYLREVRGEQQAEPNLYLNPVHATKHVTLHT